MDEEEIYYVFKPRGKMGFVSISRHEFPDFCYEYKGDKVARDKDWIVKEVRI